MPVIVREVGTLLNNFDTLGTFRSRLMSQDRQMDRHKMRKVKIKTYSKTHKQIHKFLHDNSKLGERAFSSRLEQSTAVHSC